MCPACRYRGGRPGGEGLITLGMLARAWGFLGLLSSALVMTGYFWVLIRAGWHLGAPTGTGTRLHHAYLQATTISFLGIVACQLGTAFAARADRASLRSIGFLSNRPLLVGVAFAIVAATALVITPGADPFTPTLLAIPLLLLYEASIIVLQRIFRR